MSYERNYKKGKKDVLDRYEKRPELASGLCCDGCDKFCRLSLTLQVKETPFKPRSGNQKFLVKPVMFVGDKKLYDVAAYASRCVCYPSGIEIDFFSRNAEAFYQTALAWCRVTCKHSKVR